MRVKPNFFIVGSWKAGTTSLYHYLRAHPDIFMPRVKEPHFFSEPLGYQPKIYHTLSEYEQLFAMGKNAASVGEASTCYLISKQAAARIHDYNPTSRIIIMLRHPLETLVSFHYQLAYMGRAHADVETALHAQNSPDYTGVHYVKFICSWPKCIARYLQYFGERQVRVLLFDSFVENTAKHYTETLHFLGVDTAFTPEFKIYNEGGQPTSLLGRWMGTKQAEAIARLLYVKLPYGDKLEYIRAYMELQRRRKDIPSLLPETRAELLETFTPMVEQLEQLLDRDLSHWKQ